MLQDELRQILRDLAESTGAASIAIVHEGGLHAVPPENHRPVLEEVSEELTVPVGGGAVLRARFAKAPYPPSQSNREAAMERAARALRACARRWDASTLPPLLVPDVPHTSRERVLERIHNYLHALASAQSMTNAALAHRGEVIATAHPLTDLQRERIPFTVKRVGAEASRRRGSSHADVAGEDFFAQSFYIDSCLVAFFAKPYSPDFVRHRVRQVTRELSHLLPLLDDPDDDPVQAAPIPE